MKIKAKIVLKYENERKAKAITDAISPDNVKLPELSIETYNRNSQVINLISCRKIGTLITAVDDLLRCIIIAEKTVNSIEKW